MDIKDSRIDAGKAFDWGRTSAEYARFRDIYPGEFYQKIADLGLCIEGQDVLDLGTGTGVLPRNMYRFGAHWVGTDISPEQIEQAKKLSAEAGMNIEYKAVSAEDIDYPAGSFDVVTACQCFWYFDHKKLMPKLYQLLRKDGRILVLFMAWLPYEDPVAGASEEMILKYSPNWTGGRETMHPIHIPDEAFELFDLIDHDEYLLDVPFTRESWHGRVFASRGIGASLSGEELESWDKEHWALLEKIAPKEFTVKHYAAYAVLAKKGEV
ncbi:MAG: class I SAM-dependent methyltransferase [Clostridiales bacterium]|nr:class I SAM-dependent methyltransferase [Clostridiales bacterium]